MNNVITSTTRSIGLIASNEDQPLPSPRLSDTDLSNFTMEKPSTIAINLKPPKIVYL
jgi:hypothetical protein